MKEKETCDFNSANGQHNCMNCWVKQFSLLEGLSVEELEILDKNRGTRHYKAGEVIFREGESPNGLLCLRSGKVKVSKSGLSENDAIISLNKPVDFLGLESLILEQEYCATAFALEDSSICYIGKENFLTVLNKNPGLSLRVMGLLAEKTTVANERMLVLTQKHLRGRLADALLLLRKKYGYQSDNKTLAILLKRSDLAALANMTPANAIRILSDFTKDNLIETERRKIIIKDIEGLKKVSQLG